MKFTSFGKYNLIKKIGSGGMADIFLAVGHNHTGVSRFIVIKRILSQYLENQEVKDMFRNEGKIACNLRHKNIVPMYEFNLEKNQMYIAMEYISGKNLREFMRKLGSLKKSVDIRYAVHIACQSASGLAYAHKATDSVTGKPLNLIHRDVSPQNLMVNYDGDIQLIDFGISKISDTDLTRVGHLKGKFSYMSPEQARGEPLDARTDIFCLGIILWELLSGKRVFQSKNEIDSLKKIKDCDIPPIQSLNPQVTDELAEIVHKALNKNKNLRYSCTEDFAKALSIFLSRNYPEFSQYDFISFVKNVYYTEIVNEREMLRTYTKQIKKHNNLMSTERNEGNITLMNQLNIPSIDEAVDTKSHFPNNQSSVTGIQRSEASTQSVHDAQEAITEIQGSDSSLSHTSPAPTDSKTFENSQLQTSSGLPTSKNHNTKTAELNTANLKRGELTDSSSYDDLEMKSNNDQSGDLNKSNDVLLNTISNSEDLYSNIKNLKRATTRTTQSIKKHEKIIDQDQSARKLPLVEFLSLIGLGALLLGGAIGYSNKDKLMNSQIMGQFLNKDAEIQTQQAQVIAPTKDRAPASRKRVFIQTSPSGADIYLNKKIIGSTPFVVNIPVGQPIQLDIRKNNYRGVRIQKNSAAELNNHLKISLKQIPSTEISIPQISIIN